MIIKELPMIGLRDGAAYLICKDMHCTKYHRIVGSYGKRVTLPHGIVGALAEELYCAGERMVAKHNAKMATKALLQEAE